MIINELRKLDIKNLNNKLLETRGKLFVTNFQIASGKSTNFSEVKKLKVEIARILTILKEKQTLKK